MDQSPQTNTETEDEVKTHKLVEKHIGLDQDEHILLLVRKHWVVFRNTVLIALFFPFVLLFLVYFINEWPLAWDPNIISMITNGLFIVAGICFVVGSIGTLWRWYIWSHTFYVMTNKRLAVMNQYNPWNYEVQQITLANIIDVTLTQEGLEAALYGFSDVISTTQSGSRFVFSKVGKAAEVQKAMMQELAQIAPPGTVPKPV